MGPLNYRQNKVIKSNKAEMLGPLHIL
jgi:hypothetical protein